MTSERDFDRIARAWLDLGPNGAPDRVIEAVLQAVETAPQSRRSWRWPTWRSTPMSRLPIVAVLAGLILVVVGVLALSSGSPSPAPSVAPTSSNAAVAPPSSASPDPAASGSAPGPVPSALFGSWIAPLRPVAGLTQSATSSIRFYDPADDPQAPGFDIDLGAHSFGQEARADEVEPGVLRFVSRTPSQGCEDKDVGRYRWSMPSPDRLTLELIEDVCSARQAVVAGSWIRSGIGNGDGGTGIAADFTPFFEFTLPAGVYRGGGNQHDSLEVTGQDGSVFQAIKDPDGFVDPCDVEGGKVDLEPGIDPFVAYLRSSAGLKVGDVTETTIDGNRAVQIALATADGLDPAGCFDGGSVLVGAPHSWTIGEIAMKVGSSTTLIVTEVDGATIVFWVLGPDRAVAQDVVDSIRFIDALPS